MGDVTRVQFAALSVAMQAKARVLKASDVRALRALAVDVLPVDHALMSEIVDFATAYEFARRNPYAVADLGVDLARAVEISVLPDVPDQGRVDIYG